MKWKWEDQSVQVKTPNPLRPPSLHPSTGAIPDPSILSSSSSTSPRPLAPPLQRAIASAFLITSDIFVNCTTHKMHRWVEGGRWVSRCGRSVFCMCVHIKSLCSQCLSQEAFSGHLSSEAPCFLSPFGNSRAILTCVPRHGGGCHFGDTMRADCLCFVQKGTIPELHAVEHPEDVLTDIKCLLNNAF